MFKLRSILAETGYSAVITLLAALVAVLLLQLLQEQEKVKLFSPIALMFRYQYKIVVISTHQTKPPKFKLFNCLH